MNEIQFENPIAANNVQELMVTLLDAAITIAIPIIVLFVIYAGFTYVTARGNTSKIERAHKTLGWSLVGAGVLIGAKLIAAAIIATFQQFIS